VASQYFEPQKPREKYISARFSELMLDYSCDTSNRINAKRLNRIRLENNGIQSRTICNIVEREGEKISEVIEEICQKEFENNGFSQDGIKKDETAIQVTQNSYYSEYEVREIANQSKHKIPESMIASNLYERNGTGVLQISADEVSVKKQKDTREIQDDKDQHDQIFQDDQNCKKARKQVRNTVIHLQKDDKCFIFNGHKIWDTLRMLLAFILQNNLIMQAPIVFFVDGDDTLHTCIKKMFNWVHIIIILDWFHLAKKCRERLSMGMRNRKVRNEILKKLCPLLWNGDVDGAIDLLTNIDDKVVKARVNLELLAAYLDRNREYIPCYSIRSALKLRNSSNRGEKANDLVVANRQKHNGMSWSNDGSVHQTNINTLHKNCGAEDWILKRKLTFSFDKNEAA
jgi:hypothetical protein